MLDVSKYPTKASKSHRWCLLASAAILLGGCASWPGGSTSPAQGGVSTGDSAPNIDQLPGIEPRVEAPIPGANQPYTVLGRSYVPLTGDPVFRQSGLASWYSVKYHGRRTASGELYDMYKMTAAHPLLPIPSYARVRHLASGREVIVKINDRGPFHSEHVIDLSYNAARRLGILDGSDARVEVERLTNDVIRSGVWRTFETASTPTAAGPDPMTMAAPATASYTGSAPVVAYAVPAPTPSEAVPLTQPAPGYWVQFGAFRYKDGAERFHRQVSNQVSSVAPRLYVFSENQLYRLQAGPYASRQEAVEAANVAGEALQIAPVIVQRR